MTMRTLADARMSAEGWAVQDSSMPRHKDEGSLRSEFFVLFLVLSSLCQ